MIPVVAARGLSQPRQSWAVASVLAAMVLVVLDAAIINIALPTLGASLQASPAAVVRAVTAYQLGLVVALFPAAVLGESLGLRRVFTIGVALFTLASAGCALAPSLSWLLAGRFLQGLGGAAIMALGIALLRHVVPTERFGVAIGWNALTVALSSAVGPSLGAAILSIAPWPWLFAVNLPIGLGVMAAARALPEVGGHGGRVDKTSIAFNACTFTLLIVGVEILPSRPMTGALLLLGGALTGTALVHRERGRITPLIPLDLLRSSSFRFSVIASILCFTGQAAGLVALPFYLQHIRGLTPLAAGITLTPWPLTVALAGPTAGRLAQSLPTSWLCLLGGTVLSLGLGLSAVGTYRGASLALCFSVALCGLGFGLFNVPNNRNMFLSAPRERGGAAGGLQGMARLLGQTTGAVLMAWLFSLLPMAMASRIGLILGSMLALAAGMASMMRSGIPSIEAKD